jgi:hypothetical protein
MVDGAKRRSVWSGGHHELASYPWQKLMHCIYQHEINPQFL